MKANVIFLAQSQRQIPRKRSPSHLTVAPPTRKTRTTSRLDWAGQ